MEYMPEFQLHRPKTVADAVKLRSENEAARYYAGGTDMMVNVRRGIEAPAALIDLTEIEELHSVSTDGDGLHVGAAVTLAALAADDRVRQACPAVAEAAQAVAGPTHRQYGTVGGNLCLDTRCIYYNQSEWWRASNQYCLKHRGEVCHVAPGGKRCFAAFSGDVAPAAMIHDAAVDLVGPDGARRIGLAELYRNDGLDHLTLAPGEMLTVLHLPPPSAGRRSAYAKSRVRGSIDFPLAGAAVALTMSGGKVADLRVALTGVNPHPQMVTGTEALHGAPLDDDALDRLRDMVRSQAKPMLTTTVAAKYRRRVVGALARRLAAGLAEAQ